MDCYLAFTELGAEVLEQADLLVIEFNRRLPMGSLQTQPVVVFGEQVVMLPSSLITPQRAVGWPGEGIIEDGAIFGSDPFEIGPFIAEQSVKQALGATDLDITTNVAQWLAVVADERKGFADVIALSGAC